MAVIFEVRKGCFGYKAGEEILKEITFRLQDGEVLAILGPNGVGKTTLLRNMMGLLKWKSGGSYLDGTCLAEMSVKDVWQTIAYVPQAKASLFSYTVEEMVLLGRSAHIGNFSRPKKADVEIADEAIRSVGIDYLRGKLVSRISGGELQMVLIARALTAKPRILVLDEPESNLDFRNQLIILDTIRRLADENNISCIFNTHYPAHALKISDKALILNRSGKSISGEVDEVVSKEHMEEAFGVKVLINEIEEEGHRFKSVTALALT